MSSRRREAAEGRARLGGVVVPLRLIEGEVAPSPTVGQRKHRLKMRIEAMAEEQLRLLEAVAENLPPPGGVR